MTLTNVDPPLMTSRNSFDVGWPGVELFVLGIDGRSCSACSVRDLYPKCRIGFGCDSTRPRYGRLAAPVI
jgi:hypothetical protein